MLTSAELRVIAQLEDVLVQSWLAAGFIQDGDSETAARDEANDLAEAAFRAKFGRLH